MLIQTTLFSFFLFAEEGAAVPADTSVIIFIAELVLMLVVGRLLGELMLRIRQPEVLGQLIAGILIGPTVLENLWPGAHQLIFPNTPELKKMIDGDHLQLLLRKTEESLNFRSTR